MRLALIVDKGRMKLETECYDVSDGDEREVTRRDEITKVFTTSMESTYRFTKTTIGNPILRDFDLTFSDKTFAPLLVFLKTAFTHVDLIKKPALRAINDDPISQELFDYIANIYQSTFLSEQYLQKLRSIDRSNTTEVLNHIWLNHMDHDLLIENIPGLVDTAISDNTLDYRHLIRKAGFSVRRLPETDRVSGLIKTASDQARKRFNQDVAEVSEINYEQSRRMEGENKMLLWHGTPANRVLDILQDNFKVDAREGGARGFFFSDSPEVSLNYADATRVGDELIPDKPSDVVVSCLFLAEVTLGRTGMNPRGWDDYETDQATAERMFHRKKIDSIDSGPTPEYRVIEYADIDGIRFPIKYWTEKGYVSDGPIGREYITLDPRRINIKYLILFTSKVGVDND